MLKIQCIKNLVKKARNYLKVDIWLELDLCTRSTYLPTEVDRRNISSRRLWSFDLIPRTKLSIRTLPRKKHVPLNCFFFIDSVTKLISYCIARFIRNPFLYALRHIIRSEYSTVSAVDAYGYTTAAAVQIIRIYDCILPSP